MNNTERFTEMLQQVRPDLHEILKLMDETQTDSIVVLKYLNLIRNVQAVSGWGKVITLIQNKSIKRVDQEQGYKID